ncbi:hydrogenase maturation nickel metallochaperone HypA, partial [Acinetobacter baumannii]
MGSRAASLCGPCSEGGESSTCWLASSCPGSAEGIAMHELGISRNIVAIVGDAAKGRRVRRVTLEIGKLSGVMADAIVFCFETVAQGTAL